MKKFLLIALFLVFFIAGFVTDFLLLERNNEVFIVEKFKFEPVKIDLVAVMDDNQGHLFTLTIKAQDGNGDIYINIDDPTFITDTQHSARVASSEAQKITGFDFTKIDILLSMETGQTLVAGPSAGAAMTLGIIATVTNKKIKSDVSITGTIEQGGIIGPVGGILEKAKGAKAAGKKTLLVPKGESVLQSPVQVCAETSSEHSYTKSCTVKYNSTSVQDEVGGIEIIEVSTIEEAAKLMLE